VSDPDQNNKLMILLNDASDQGYWQAYDPGRTLIGNDVWLGTDGCENYDATTCFSTYIGEHRFRLSAPVDVKSWGTHYDLAKHCNTLKCMDI
jgi:hypothetical protein